MRLRRLRKVFLVFGLAVFLAAGTASAAPILAENSHGHDVFKLQRELKRTGYLTDEPDGIFGSRTKNAVLAFQRAERLKETGVVDRETWSRLQKETPTPPPMYGLHRAARRIRLRRVPRQAMRRTPPTQIPQEMQRRAAARSPSWSRV